MKKLLIITLLLALPILANAYERKYDVQVDGIYYKLNHEENTAEVSPQAYDGGSYQSDYSGSVNIPEKFIYDGVEYFVTSIGQYAFSYCTGLTSVTIPNSVTAIERCTFWNCSGLTSVIIPNSVTSIGDFAFSGCSDLTTVTIPNSVTSIGYEAFYGCSGLTLVTIPKSVTTIGVCPFASCNGLKSIVVENGNPKYDSRNNSNAIIETNSNTLISGCMNTIISTSVTSIGESAFDGCSGLKSITIPNSVTTIGRGAFRGCSNLTSINISNSVTEIQDYTFSGCSSLVSINIPNSVISIGGGAFSYCTGLTVVIIPNSVKTLGWKYPEDTFSYCRNIVSVVSKMEYPCTISSGCFTDDVFKNSTLYIPKGTMERYMMKDFWNKFENIVEGEPGGSVIPGTPQCATPSISYANKELTFSCDTEGVEYKYTITDSDVKTDYASKVSLSATYEISVYAMKEGLGNSDVATATLVWTDATFTETTESSISAKAVTESIPVLISSQNGTITVKCEQEGQPVAVYTTDGKMVGSAKVSNGQASIATNLQNGQVAIVKVGNRSVKITAHP